MALTEEQKADLAKLTPAELVAKLAANHEILDRHDTNRQTAEQKAAALEKKITDDAEAARLATLSEIDKAKAETAKEKKLREDAEATHKRDKSASAAKLMIIQAGGVDASDVMALLPPGVIDQEEAAVKAAVAALKAKYPPMFGASGNGWLKEGEHGDTGTGNRGKGPVISQAELDKMQDKDPAAWRATRKRIVAKELTLLD